MATNLETLTAKANDLNSQLAGYRRRTLELSRELGETLLAMKAIVGHGNWKSYRQDNFAGSSGTAERCQRIAQHWNDECFKRKREAEPDLCFNAAWQFLQREAREKPDTTAQALLTALESLQAGLTRKDEIEQSSCFAFRDGMVFTFNDHVACSVPNPLGGKGITGAVGAAPLLSLLRSVASERVTFSIEGSEFMVRGTELSAGLHWQRKIELPIEKVEPPGDWLPLPENLSDAIGVASQCTSKDMSQYLACCIHIHPKHVEACDNSQAVRYPLDLPISEPFLVVASSIQPAASLGMTEMSVGDKWVHFRNPDGLVYSCRRDSQPYPPLDDLLRMEGEILTLPKGIAEAALRAGVFSVQNPDENEIEVEIVDQTLTLLGRAYCRGSKPGIWYVVGWYRESLALSTAIQNPVKFIAGPKMLAEFAKRHADVEVRITPGLLSVTTERFTYVVALGELKDPPPEKRSRRAYAEPWQHSVTAETFLSFDSPGA